MKNLVNIIIIALLVGCTNKDKAASDRLTLQFEGRNISLAPYFEGFPYQQFSVDKDGQKLFFFKSGNENRLQWLEISPEADLRNAQNAAGINFATRNCWSPRYNAVDGFIYWIGDENNDEIINIYRANLGGDTAEKLTDVPYIYAWEFNPARTKIAYVARLGQNEERLDELRILDLQSGKDELVCQDTPTFRFTWSDINWQPEEKGLTLLALKGIDRTYTNLVYVDLQTKAPTLLTDSSRAASLSGCQALGEWAASDECIFLSDQDGYANLYSFRLVDKSVKQLTFYTQNVDDAAYLTVAGKRHILLLQSNPIETMLTLMDAETKEVKFRQPSSFRLQIGTTNRNRAILIAGSTTELFQLLEGEVEAEGITLTEKISVPAELKKELVQSTVKRLEIPTFDIDSATGRQRLLHAYLYKPTTPLPAEKELVMIESFYGGENRYNTGYQILAQAGIYVLSPSPRGSAGFGREFAAMNDGDLGGDEIIDIIYAAQYISKELNIPPSRIGVFGMSHGGYATMRLMTFPGEVNGHKAAFFFGFGIETAGFCDIIWQHRHSNIPDWTALEAGDPDRDSLRLVDRSPITHAERISGPILLLHGNHDNRVDIGGSRFMAEKLKELGKPYRYVEFSGLGHGIKGTENNRKLYAEYFDFLQSEVLK
ncbi:MAG: prolyl oligopeptidase family serine peptidase [Tannerellaceae bacterium]|jgi:dipeptidyl aminopeptidase/acylaminoacyl peptidase|nr:prolyl oligopeptidase family serine peptidase [Tannerellaceae bacterium]